METLTKKQICICFAFFGDGIFLGWYADTFGSVRKNQPKLYTYSDAQLSIIRKNFTSKLQSLHEKSDLGAIVPGLGLLDDSVNADRQNLKQYKRVELRVVECPHYDGPNPDFDKEAYTKLTDERDEKLKQFLLENSVPDNFCKERLEAVQKFDKQYPYPPCNNWTYADYKKVQEWANNEPTTFVETLAWFMPQ